MPSPPEPLVRLELGAVAVTVDLDHGARATSWTVDGEELLHHRSDNPVEYGMYPMAPWCGRIRDNHVSWEAEDVDLPVTYPPWALHGTALFQQARVVEHVQRADQARLLARVDGHPGWPWPMAVDVEWLLEPGRLTTRITVHALEEPFPCVVGWHPWFRRSLSSGGPLQWELAASSRLVRGPDHLPTGDAVPFDPADGPFDDAFAVPGGTARVTWPEVLDLEIRSDGGWFVVFDEFESAACVEPQSGPPDGLRSGADRPSAYGPGPSVAAPGRPHVLTTTWTVSPLR